MVELTLTGTREGVLQAVRAAKAEKSDPAQIAAVKLFVEAEILALPPEVNGCKVDVRADVTTARTAQFTVIPLKLQV